MRRTLALLSLTFASLCACLVAATACGDGTTAPAASVAGSYRLARVNGAALPMQIPGGLDGNPARITGGSAILDEAKRWSAQVTFAIDAAGATVPLTRTFSGIYTVSRDTVRLRDAVDGEVIVAVVRGARLSANVDGETFDFDR